MVLSHPLWVRGLKSFVLFTDLYNHSVAPFMGAWIEIFLLLSANLALSGRTLYGCVD